MANGAVSPTIFVIVPLYRTFRARSFYGVDPVAARYIASLVTFLLPLKVLLYLNRLLTGGGASAALRCLGSVRIVDRQQPASI